LGLSPVLGLRDRFNVAYTLLPPPLSSLPAKYWSSVSLLLHSYTVGRAFEELVGAYFKDDAEAPTHREAFIIGFIHDLGQKLRLRGKASEGPALDWFRERLELLGMARDEIRHYEKYLYTNPAETGKDPSYPDEVWALLRLADQLQGVGNPLEVAGLLGEVKARLHRELYVKYLNVSLPQQYLRALISTAIEDYLQKYTRESSEIVIPISTPMGVAVITDNPDLQVAIDWEEIREGFGGGLLDAPSEERLRWCARCCEDDECRSRCSGKVKPQECRENGYTQRDCEEGLHPDGSGNSYKIALAYYGHNGEDGLRVVLPEGVKGMFQGVVVNGVDYASGESTCPICGLRTPVGVPGDFIKFFGERLKTEHWARRLYPGNVNVIMSGIKEYAIDPLCLGDIIIRSTYFDDILVSLTLRVFTPLNALAEIATLLGALVNLCRDRRFSCSAALEDTKRVLESLGSTRDRTRIPVYDAFTTAISASWREKRRSHLDEWVEDITLAGVLAGWGLYPLVISPAIPTVPTEVVLSYYKGQKPLYDFRPSDRHYGSFLPYVSVTMSSLEELSDRRSQGESLPALLEVLDYPPDVSPVLAQYGSPHMSSLLESFEKRIMGGL